MGALRGLVAACALTIATVSTLAGAVAANHQTDAGLPGDAPNDRNLAMDVAFATIEGVLAAPNEDDFVDWYRVPATPEMGVRVRLSSPQGGVNLEVLADDGRFLGGGCCGPGPGTNAETFVAPDGPALRLGVSVGFVGGPYTLDLALVQLADLTIADVRILEHPVVLGGTPLVSGLQRTLQITITNEGPGTAYQAGGGAWVEHSESRDRPLGGFGLGELASGASSVVEVPWDTTGEIGDVVVHVNVGTVLERDPEDNDRRVRAHVLVGGLGRGVDLAQNEVSDCDLAGCVYARTAYEPWEQGAWANWDILYPQLAGWAHVGTHPGQTHATTGPTGEGALPFVDVSVDRGRPRAQVCALQDLCLVQIG